MTPKNAHRTPKRSPKGKNIDIEPIEQVESDMEVNIDKPLLFKL
jgi:hypothetical protein